MKVSTRTASRLPEMRVDEIGDHSRRSWPGGRSLMTMGMPGVTNTFQLKKSFITCSLPCRQRDVAKDELRPRDQAPLHLCDGAGDGNPVRFRRSPQPPE